MTFFSTSLNTTALRYQTIGVAMLLLTLFISLQQYIAYKKFNELVEDKITTKSEKAEIFYNHMMKERFKIQTTAIEANLNSPGVKTAVVAQDREGLIKLLLNRYNTMHNSFPHINIMHFVLPNTHSLLRLHQLNAYGDDLSGVRPMHLLANEKLQSLHGLEVGKYGVSYRTVHPNKSQLFRLIFTLIIPAASNGVLANCLIDKLHNSNFS